MKKNLWRILTVVVCLALLLAIAGCGSKNDAAEESSAPAEESPAETDASSPEASAPEAEAYTIGFTNLCTGIWSIDYGQQNVENYIEPHGVEVMAMSANFSADQMIKDVQNMVESGCRGLLVIPVMPTMLASVSDLCEGGEVYFSGFSQLILGENKEMMEENPYYCGSIGINGYEAGKHIGQMALDDGKSKAVILAGAIGNTNHDNLIAGFTEVFEAGGGEILGVGHSETEATQRADDLIAAYGNDIDCAFGMGMDFADSLINACDNYGLKAGEDIMVYAAELDANGVERVKSGLMGGLSQQCVDSAFSAALVMNAIDGNRLVDSEGNPVWSDRDLLFEINKDNADNYQKYWIDGFPLPNESFDELLYRCNPDVSYDSYMEFIENYSYETVMALRGE